VAIIRIGFEFTAVNVATVGYEVLCLKEGILVDSDTDMLEACEHVVSYVTCGFLVQFSTSFIHL
jgi:hypothetical protein